jgi:ABC-2 type transport system ATP-binding protein
MSETTVASGSASGEGAEQGTLAAALPKASDVPLVFEQISHWYGDVVAVNSINATVNAGITGLLGPNGAG